MSFMEAEMTDKQEWVEVDGNCGIEFIPAELVDINEVRAVIDNMEQNYEDSMHKLHALIRDYLESTRVFNAEITMGYGVRSSASGYMDCTSWSVYSTKKEALQAARQEQRECDGLE